jgi:hypothetical protein
MGLVQGGLRRLAVLAGGVQSLAAEAGRAGGYALRTFGAPPGLRGLVLESAWLAAHVVLYPIGLAGETIRQHDVHRTDDQ